MKKRRLISLMLAGVLATGVVGLSGCTQSKDDEFASGACYPYRDRYIIIEDKDGLDVLHKGDFYEGYKDANNAFDFECSEIFLSNKTFSTYNKKPKEETYDIICEDCFLNE